MRNLTMAVLLGMGVLLAAAAFSQPQSPEKTGPKAVGPAADPATAPAAGMEKTPGPMGRPRPPEMPPDMPPGPPPGPGPGMEEGPPRGGPPWRGRPVTKEQEDEVLAYLKEKDQDTYESFVKSRQSDPYRYRMDVASMWHWLSRTKTMPDHVRDAHEAYRFTTLRMWRAARELAGATDATRKAALEAELQELGEKRFQAEQVIRDHRLTELAEQIKRLRAELDERAQNRKILIQEMIARFRDSAARKDFFPTSAPASRPGRDHGPRPKP